VTRPADRHPGPTRRPVPIGRAGALSDLANGSHFGAWLAVLFYLAGVLSVLLLAGPGDILRRLDAVDYTIFVTMIISVGIVGLVVLRR